jgi:hypothetical protein
MVSGFQHDQRTEKDGAVIQKRMEARKGDAGIVAQNIGGIEEIDRAAQEPQGTNVSAAHITDVPLSPYRKGHGVHKNTARIQRKHAAELKIDRSSGIGFPYDLYDLKAGDRDPYDHKAGSDRLLAFFGKGYACENDQKQKARGKDKVERRKQGSRQVAWRRKKILMGKEIFDKKNEIVHDRTTFLLNECQEFLK